MKDRISIACDSSNSSQDRGKEYELTRIGISLPDTLLENFDKILRLNGFSSRSEGIRDAIRSYIQNSKWMEGLSGICQGIIIIAYDHRQPNLAAQVTDIQHEFYNLIEVSLHTYISQSRCAEVILLKGEAQKIRIVSERLMALRGVEAVNLMTISLEE